MTLSQSTDGRSDANGLSSGPSLSIVIATLNREQVLCNTIRSVFEKSQGRSFELIVVDQSEAHEESTTRYLAALGDRIVYRRVSYKSLPRARNEGLSLARGEVVLFIDDDVEILPGFFDGHLAPYADPRVWVVTGPTPLSGERIKSRHEISDEEYRGLLADDKLFIHVDFDHAPCSWAVGCNFSVRKSAALGVGAFDVNFLANAIGEDAEFCGRIKKHGGIIYYSGRAALVHLVEKSGGCRTDVGATYVKMFAYNQNYFLRAIGKPWSSVLKSNLRSYRQFVMNRSNALNAQVHLAFLAGLYEGRRKPLAEMPKSIEGRI